MQSRGIPLRVDMASAVPRAQGQSRCPWRSRQSELLAVPGLPASSRTSGSGSSPCAEERQHEPIAAWPRPGSSRLASRSTEAAFADPDGHHETNTRRATRRRGSGRHLARPSGSLMWNPSRMRRMAVRSQSDMKLPSLPGGPEEYRRG